MNSRSGAFFILSIIMPIVMVATIAVSVTAVLAPIAWICGWI